MDEQFSGVPASSDTGSASPSSDSANSSVGFSSEPSASSQVDPFVQFAQDARAANIADTSNNVADTPASPEVAAEAENEGESALPDGLQLPENDDDLRGLTDENAKNHIQGLRQHVRQNLEPKAKQYDAQQALFQQYGITPEFVEPSAKLFSGLIATTQVPVQTENGVVMQDYMTTEPFWNELANTSQDHLSQALYDAAQMYSGYLLQNIPKEQIFQAIGLNPALAEVYGQVREDGTLNGLAPASAVNQEILNSLPAELQATFAEIAKSDPELAAELEFHLQGDTPRIAHQILKGEKFQREADAEKRASAERAQAEQAERVAKEGQQRLSSYWQEGERAFLDDLSKTYTPYGTGPDSKADNDWIHANISRAVSTGLAADTKAASLVNGLNDALQRGNQLAVTQLRAQLEPHIARLRSAEIERYDKLFRRAVGNEQQQREASAKLKSVNGLGGFSEDRPGNGLANPDDLNDPANFLAMARNLGVRIGQ